MGSKTRILWLASNASASRRSLLKFYYLQIGHQQISVMKLLKFIIGLLLGIVVFITPFSQFQASPLESIRNIPVQLDGRKKPLDTVARETVIQIHGRANYQATDGAKLDYLQTYLSLWSNNRDWNEEPFILFNYRPLKTELGLDSRKKVLYLCRTDAIASRFNNRSR